MNRGPISSEVIVLASNMVVAYEQMEEFTETRSVDKAMMCSLRSAQEPYDILFSTCRRQLASCTVFVQFSITIKPD